MEIEMPSLIEQHMPYIPLKLVEQELTKYMKQAQGPGEAPVHRSRMSNLIVFCDSEGLAIKTGIEIPAVVSYHPARVLLLIADETAKTQPDEPPVQVAVNVWCQVAGGKQRACSEEVILRAKGRDVERLPFVIRGLLLSDLPCNLWWASTVPPPLADRNLADLSDHVQQIVYDSLGWQDPHRGMARIGHWVARNERNSTDPGGWRVVSDLNWRRLKYWRRLLAQGLSPAVSPGALTSITELVIEHGPHAVTQGWILAGWLAARLGWRVQGARMKPGVELVWQVVAPHGGMRLVIRRLPDGPSEIRQVKVKCAIDQNPHTLLFFPGDGRHLAMRIEGSDTAARTVSTQADPVAELVGRQLSDRERDPVFREAMQVVQVFAQSLLQ